MRKGGTIKRVCVTISTTCLAKTRIGNKRNMSGQSGSD
jgi:hypothetical protein